MATKTKYPYTAFMLTPSYNLRQVTVAREGWYTGYDVLGTGTDVHRSNLYDTREAAIAAGKKKLEQRRARLAKSAANIEKHAANLAEVEGGNG